MKSKSSRKAADEDEAKSKKLRSSRGKQRRRGRHSRSSSTSSRSESPPRKRSKKLKVSDKKSTKNKGGGSRRRHRSLSPSSSPSSSSMSYSTRSSGGASERSVSPPRRSRSRDVRKKKERGRDSKRMRRSRRSTSYSTSEYSASSRSRSRSKNSKSKNRKSGGNKDHASRDKIVQDYDNVHAHRAENVKSVEIADRDEKAMAVTSKGGSIERSHSVDHEKNASVKKMDSPPTKDADETEDILPAGSGSPDAQDLELILRQKALENFRKFRGAALMAGKTQTNGTGKEVVTESPKSSEMKIAEASSVDKPFQRQRSGLSVNCSVGSPRLEDFRNHTTPRKQESSNGKSVGAETPGKFEAGSTSGQTEQKVSSLEPTRSNSQIRIQDGRSTSSSIMHRLESPPRSSASVIQRSGSSAGVSYVNGNPRVRSVVSIPNKEGLDSGTSITPPSACGNSPPVENISEVRHPPIETNKVEGTKGDERNSGEASAPNVSTLSTCEAKDQPGTEVKDGSQFEKKTFSRMHEGETVQDKYCSVIYIFLEYKYIYWAELPGFYYDPVKNRYFPIRGPIPGAATRCPAPPPPQAAAAGCRKRARQAELVHAREMYGGGVIFSNRRKSTFMRQCQYAQASQPMAWKYKGTALVADKALEELYATIQTPIGLKESKVLVTGSMNGTVRLYGLGTAIANIEDEMEFLPEPSWTPLGNVVLCGLRNGSIFPLDVRQKQHNHPIELASPGTARRTVPLTPRRHNRWRNQCRVGHFGTSLGHRTGQSLVVLSSDEHYFLGSSMDGSIKLFDLRLIQKGPIQSYPGHINSHTHLPLVVDPSETLLMSGGEDNTVRIWSIKTGEQIFAQSVAGSLFTALCWPESGDDLHNSSLFGLNHSWGAWMGSRDGLFYMHEAYKERWCQQGMGRKPAAGEFMLTFSGVVCNDEKSHLNVADVI
uniref:Uncharacterized protein n=1 Tax=Oryza punctata TaxID=4537 RepID=A0A0E0LG59_ORYPU